MSRNIDIPAALIKPPLGYGDWQPHLANPVVKGEQTKVRLIEEAFHNAMWAGETS